MENKCKNCKHFRKLKIFRRIVETLGGHGVVCGWKVGINPNYYNSSCCCTLFMSENDSPIFETSPEDHCENWEAKE